MDERPNIGHVPTGTFIHRISGQYLTDYTMAITVVTTTALQTKANFLEKLESMMSTGSQSTVTNFLSLQVNQ